MNISEKYIDVGISKPDNDVKEDNMCSFIIDTTGLYKLVAFVSAFTDPVPLGHHEILNKAAFRSSY